MRKVMAEVIKRTTAKKKLSSYLNPVVRLNFISIKLMFEYAQPANPILYDEMRILLMKAFSIIRSRLL